MQQLVANGIRQSFLREGNTDRPVIVLVHPVGFDHTLWDDVAPLLTPQWQVLRYDLRGHGGTDVPAGDYSVELLAADVLALTHELGIELFDFYGVSLGGLVGLWLGARKPGVLKRLAVSNLAAKLPLPAEEWNRRISLARSSGLTGFADGISQRMFSEGYRTGEGRFKALLNGFLAMDPGGYASGMAALRDADLTPLLGSVSVPTLVMGGVADAAVPPEQIALIGASVPGATLAMMPGGHLSPVEAPLETVAALTAFMHGA